MNRKSPYIPIRVRELKQIAQLNSLSTFFVGLTVAFFMLFLGCIWDVAVGGAFENNKGSAVALMVVFLLIAFVNGLVAHRLHIAKATEIQEILAECPEYATYRDSIDSALKQRRMFPFLSNESSSGDDPPASTTALPPPSTPNT